MVKYKRTIGVVSEEFEFEHARELLLFLIMEEQTHLQGENNNDLLEGYLGGAFNVSK